MARIRTIKPGAWSDERVAATTQPARLLWVVLLTLADDDGRFRVNPLGIVGHGYPNELDMVGRVEPLIDELETIGLVQTWRVGGQRYGVLRGWSRHQRISHKTDSVLPEPPAISGAAPEVFRKDSGTADSTHVSSGFIDSGAAPESLRLERRGEEGIGEERSGSAGEPATAAADPLGIDSWLDEIWALGRQRHQRWSSDPITEAADRSRVRVLLNGTTEQIARSVMRDALDKVMSPKGVWTPLPDLVRTFIGAAERRGQTVGPLPTGLMAPTTGQQVGAARDAADRAAFEALRNAEANR